MAFLEDHEGSLVLTSQLYSLQVKCFDLISVRWALTNCNDVTALKAKNVHVFKKKNLTFFSLLEREARNILSL